jgi:hypothetical protein
MLKRYDLLDIFRIDTSARGDKDYRLVIEDVCCI